MPDAIEQAQKTLKPATSAEEDAVLLADLIHALAIQGRSVNYERIANGRAETDPFVRTGPNGMALMTKDDAGEARDGDGNAVRSIRQQLTEFDNNAQALWEQADKDGIRRLVEERLADAQRKWLAQMSQNGNRPEG